MVVPLPLAERLCLRQLLAVDAVILAVDHALDLALAFSAFVTRFAGFVDGDPFTAWAKYV
jgi:hypothetical protein